MVGPSVSHGQSPSGSRPMIWAKTSAAITMKERPRVRQWVRRQRRALSMQGPPIQMSIAIQITARGTGSYRLGQKPDRGMGRSIGGPVARRQGLAFVDVGFAVPHHLLPDSRFSSCLAPSNFCCLGDLTFENGDAVADDRQYPTPVSVLLYEMRQLSPRTQTPVRHPAVRCRRRNPPRRLEWMLKVSSRFHTR